MITARAVADELRKLADNLDQNPELEVQSPNMYFSCSYLGEKSKQIFLNVVKNLPRPLQKEYKANEVWVKYSTDAINVSAYINRNKVCRIVEPAKAAVYDCEPLLSETEEALIA